MAKATSRSYLVAWVGPLRQPQVALMAWVIESGVEGFAIARFEIEPPPKELKPPLEYFEERGIMNAYGRLSKSDVDIEDRYWPRRAKLTTRRKALPNIVTFFSFTGISEDFLDCLDRFEPGVHDCRPVEVVGMDDRSFPQKFYAVNFRRVIRDAVRWDLTTTPLTTVIGGRTRLQSLRTMDSGHVYLDRQAVSGLHLWILEDIINNPMTVSNELYECLFSRKLLRGLRTYELVEV